MQAGTLLCTRSISFLVGSVLLPHFKAKATSRTSAQHFRKRQHALRVQAAEGNPAEPSIRTRSTGGGGGSSEPVSRDPSPPMGLRRRLMEKVSKGLQGSDKGGPCTVEPSCAPAVLLAAESGVGIAAVRADAQLQQVEGLICLPTCLLATCTPTCDRCCSCLLAYL